MGGADYQPNFDIDSLIDDLTNQLFDQATQESVSDGFELARQELSRMLVEDSIAQDMAKKVATADYAGDKGQNVGEGTAFESDGTDNDGQDGDYQYQESKIGTAVEAHRESIDPDEHDGCEDEIDVVETVHGCLEQGHAVEEDRVGSGDEDEQFEDGHEHGGLDIEESDSDSSSSDSGSDWAPKKKKTVAARKLKKRSREFFETAEERETRWQNHKRRKIEIAQVKEAAYEKNSRRIQKDKEPNACYHPFGACEGLYLGVPPSNIESDSEDDLAWNYSETLDHGAGEFRPPVAQKSRKRSFAAEEGESIRPAKKSHRALAGNSGKRDRSPQRPLSDAQKWFLEQGKIKPGPVSVKKLRAGSVGRSYGQKRRGDWGNPKDSITKAQMYRLRKHFKHTTTMFDGKNDTKAVNNVTITHREALRFNAFLGPRDTKYSLERGDVSEEDPIIDGHLIKFEMERFQKIRRGKRARRQRLARGEDQDDESDLSSDDSQYGDDKATCGWDLEERMDYYLAKQAAKKDGVEDEYDGADEDDVPKPQRRKNKGKGRALAGADGEPDYKEESYKPRRKSKGGGKGRAAVQDVQELDYDHGHYPDYEEAEAIPSTAESTQTIQDDAQSDSSVESEAD